MLSHSSCNWDGSCNGRPPGRDVSPATRQPHASRGRLLFGRPWAAPRRYRIAPRERSARARRRRAERARAHRGNRRDVPTSRAFADGRRRGGRAWRRRGYWRVAAELVVRRRAARRCKTTDHPTVDDRQCERVVPLGCVPGAPAASSVLAPPSSPACFVSTRGLPDDFARPAFKSWSALTRPTLKPSHAHSYNRDRPLA